MLQNGEREGHVEVLGLNLMVRGALDRESGWAGGGKGGEGRGGVSSEHGTRVGFWVKLKFQDSNTVVLINRNTFEMERGQRGKPS